MMMMIMMMMVNTGWALDCAALEPSTCDAANGIAQILDAETGSPVVHAGAPARLQPMQVYNQLEQVRLGAIAASCRADGLHDGWTGAAYNLRTQDWSGAFEDADTGPMNGTMDRATHTVAGTVFPTQGADLAVGDQFSGWNRQHQVAASRGTGFVVGKWIRTRGKRGVTVMLHGTCDQGVDPGTAIESWFVGSLTVFTPPTRSVLFTGTGDDDYTLYVDGVAQARTLPNSHQWSTPSDNLVDLSPGTHTVAAYVFDTGGRPMMFQLRAELEGMLLLNTETGPTWRTAIGTPTSVPGFADSGFDDSAWILPTACGNGTPTTTPWNDPLDTNDATPIWFGSCTGSARNVLFRATVDVP